MHYSSASHTAERLPSDLHPVSSALVCKGQIETLPMTSFFNPRHEEMVQPCSTQTFLDTKMYISYDFHVPSNSLLLLTDFQPRENAKDTVSSQVIQQKDWGGWIWPPTSVHLSKQRISWCSAGRAPLGPELLAGGSPPASYSVHPSGQFSNSIFFRTLHSTTF